MKVKTLSALAGLGGALILSGESQAAYLGLGMKLHTTVSVAGAGGGMKDVYRLYAVFDHVDDNVTAVGGSVANGPLSISTFLPANLAAGGNFYNPGSGSNQAPVSTSGSFSPAVKQWDTFATIGYASDDSANSDYSLGFTPGFPTFIAGNALASGNAAWFVAGDSIQGAAGGTGNGNFTGQFQNFGVDGPNGMGVMIAQLTVISGQGVMGSLFVNGVLGGALAGNTYTETNQGFSSHVIPAPGALALLGLAGLVGTRRRRA